MNKLTDINNFDDNRILQFHIPDPFKVGEHVAQIGAGEVRKILNQVLPQALKDLPDEIIHELVQKVLIPVLSDVLKPIEKEVFKTGVDVLEAMHKTMTALLAGADNVPQTLIDRAWTYYWEGDDPENRENWGRVLIAFYQTDTSFDPKWPAMTAEEAWQENVTWDGWKPFAKELDILEAKRKNPNPNDNLYEAFDKCQWNFGVIGNIGVTLWFTNVYSRMPTMISTLRRYEGTGVPAKRHDILAFMRAMGPDWINIDIKAELDIGIDFGASASCWNIPTPLAYKLLDDIMKTAGVPE